ncbi:MAG TPA: TIGR00366 family protein [Bacteroidales bacterium]|nr:TIGR00366 family protein [Bacteroidales bacterium]HRX97891.1 TIGR00366 family protein [Bacteroidales bacterium]
MNLAGKINGFFIRFFPSTFTISVILTFLTFVLAAIFTDPVNIETSANSIYSDIISDPLSKSNNHFAQLAGFWYQGMWNTGMLAFTVQMMLILVLGYVMAATSGFQNIIRKVLAYCSNTAKSAFLVALITLLVSFFNWGLGLIFGALFARKVAEYAQTNKISLNYPLIGAAGYSGLMVWHGGISGSAPLKVAEAGHLKALTGLDLAPITFNQTIFSGMNLTVSLLLITLVPILLYYLGKKNPGEKLLQLEDQKSIKVQSHDTPTEGAEKIDRSRWVSLIIGMLIMMIAILKAIKTGNAGIIDPNYLNFILLGLGLTFSANISSFLGNVKNAMGAAGGILIQFPLYFGIMGIMKYSGMVEIFSGFLMNISNVETFPLFTFLSAALVNIFVPSGGGQWAVQGPIIIEAAQNLGIPLGKAVMALAYGDQITNMLQPFWALPLLGITGLKAGQIIPYTLLLLCLGFVIFLFGIIVF